MAKTVIRMLGQRTIRLLRDLFRAVFRAHGTGIASVRLTARGLQVHVPETPIEETWLGVIVTRGPNDEEDFDDHRYWVRRARASNTREKGSDAFEPTKFEREPRTSAATVPAGVTRYKNLGEPLPDETVAATNLAEAVVAADPDTGPHMLPAGTPVRVFVTYDQARRRRYYLWQTSPHVSFPVKIKVKNPEAKGECETQFTDGSTCDFQYEVWDLYQSRLIKDDVTPLIPRVPLIEYHVPEDYTIGYGFWDEEGVFQLGWVLQERPRLYSGIVQIGDFLMGSFTEGLLACVNPIIDSGSGSGSSSGSSGSTGGGTGCDGVTAAPERIDKVTCIVKDGCIYLVHRIRTDSFVAGCYQGVTRTRLEVLDCPLEPCAEVPPGSGSGSGSGSGGSGTPTARRYVPCDEEADLDPLYFDPDDEVPEFIRYVP